MEDLLNHLAKNIEPASFIAAIVSILFSVLFASKELLSVKKYTLDIKDNSITKTNKSFKKESGKKQEEELLEFVPGSNTEEKEQFENRYLSSYYQQVLYQSKISFWFSLIFASLGFLVIILSIFLYKEGNFDKSVLSIISGLIIDAVSALFFVQANRAQKAMGEFFKKLRLDKNNLESRKICEAVENKQVKDILKIQLSLKLAEINPSNELNDNIIEILKK